MDRLIDQSIKTVDHLLNPPRSCLKALLAECAGVAIFHSVGAALIVSASVAHGIVLKRHGAEWSPPSAVSMANIGVGLAIGAKTSDIIMILGMDQDVRVLSSQQGIEIGGNLSIKAGPVDATHEVDLNASAGGGAITYCYAISEGAFVGASVETGVLTSRPGVNADFYNSGATPEDILFHMGTVKAPEGSRLPELHEKLNLLMEGHLQPHVANRY